MKVLRLIKFLFTILLSALWPVLFFLFVLISILFFEPTLLINPGNLSYTLSKTHLLKKWSWKNGEISHKWLHWNDRVFSGSFDHFCFLYDKEGNVVDTCMEKLYWNVEIRFDKKLGVTTIINEPLVIDSSFLTISLKKKSDKKEEATSSDYFRYWSLFWSKIVPDLDFTFHKITLQQEKGEDLRFDFRLIKKDAHLWASALNFNLYATPEKIEVMGPHRYRVPYDLKTREPLYFEELKLRADLSKEQVDLSLDARIANATLTYKSAIRKKELSLPKEKLLQSLLLRGIGKLEIKKLVSTIYKLMRPPFNILPAPFNVLEGPLSMNLVAKNLFPKNELVFLINTNLNLSGAGQFLILDLDTDVPFSLASNKIGALRLGLDFKKVLLRLPKLAKNKLPPQLKPDSRIIGVNTKAIDKRASSKVKKPQKEIPVDLELEAIGDHALEIKTNLLDEILRLNLKLAVDHKTLKHGFVEIFPLKTTLFKRPIFVPQLKLTFQAPLEPEIKSVIEFRLPEYKVTLKIQGPLSKPRTAFSSEPPLPQDDIIAVLLFGRPLSGLSADDKSATQNVGQIISQGILSLAVLYYLAGSPVESLGYDPDSKVVSAQFGISKRSSLHVESGKSGEGAIVSYGVRHSLGKGWYIDTTVAQKTSNTTSQSGKNLGVLLERIIAY